MCVFVSVCVLKAHTYCTNSLVYSLVAVETSIQAVLHLRQTVFQNKDGRFQASRHPHYLSVVEDMGHYSGHLVPLSPPGATEEVQFYILQCSSCSDSSECRIV